MLTELTDKDGEEKPPGIGLLDIARMLFKHKWKLCLVVLVSFGAAAAIYLTHTPHYESTSKILVRYVEEVSNVDATPEGGSRSGPTNDSVITAEAEILRSWDLAEEVVAQITPAVILRNAPETSPALAAKAFVKALEVDPPKGSRVITVTYRHPDPDVAVKALTILINTYLDKHVEFHRATKSRETSRSRLSALTARIAGLTEQIEQLKADNGVSSLTEAAAGLNKRAEEIHTQTESAKADLQEQIARVAELKKLGLIKEGPVKGESGESATESLAGQATVAGDPSVQSTYKVLLRELNRLQEEELKLLGTYSRESTPVRQNRALIEEAEKRRASLEEKHPALLAVGPPITAGSPVSPAIEPTVEVVRLSTLTARVEYLTKREEALKLEFKQFANVSKRLHELERDRELQTQGLKQFAENFQRTEFETPLKAADYDNIVIVQKSSPPILALSKLFKLIAGVIVGGVGLGVGLIAFLELMVNRSVKRPLELETRVGIPLMMHIPYASPAERRRLTGVKTKGSGKPIVLSGTEAWAAGHFIRPFAESIRDRLVLYFEQIGLTRKPKLVGVTGYSKGSGVSTIACGIAAALSETGDGKVLLVDLNVAHAEVHPFFEGKPAASLMEALAGGAHLTSAADNLYLATATSRHGEKTAQLFPKRFYDMLPTFQASEFDYIIFDMPPMNESSLPLAMSGFMDQMLMVVEAEKDNRDAVKRASGDLIRARAKLSGVLNKTRAYGPKWLLEA